MHTVTASSESKCQLSVKENNTKHVSKENAKRKREREKKKKLEKSKNRNHFSC